MRIHITLPDEIVANLDRRVGPRQRSGFIVRAVRAALEDEHRWELVESALGSIPSEGHEWDQDPAAWVHEGRRADTVRIG
jgi:hypothetical protein